MADRPEVKLNDEARAFVVCALASFDTPSIIAAAVKREFDLTISRQGIEVYDPTKRMGRNLSEKWKTLFTQARKAFLEDTSTIPISHKASRLRALNRMASLAEEKGNVALAAQLLKQAAEECGEVYTNRHKIEASVTNRIDPREMSDDELAAIAASGSSGITDPAKS